MLVSASLLIEGPRLCGNQCIILQDNTVNHNAGSAKDIFLANDVMLWEHLTYSPEFVVAWKEKSVDRNINFKLHGLSEDIFTTWNNIAASILRTLLLTMSKASFWSYLQWWMCISTTERSCWIFLTFFRIYFMYGFKILTSSYLISFPSI